MIPQDLATDAYRPGTRLRRYVRLRDRGCTFPGCNVPATGCDLDHATPHHHDGRTDPRNLHCLCRRHHQAKQSKLFRVHRRPDGVTVWTTRDGTQHIAPARAG